MKPIRIWYQSYVDEANGKIYWDRLRRHLADLVDPGTTVEIKGITPHDNYAHAIVEFRCAREVICNAVKAEREGYDAFVVGHFQDAGLYEARSVVDIPVVALGEASMLYACQLGQRTGIVTINPRFIPWFHHQIGKYGLEKRVTGVHAMTFEPGQILKAYEFGRAGDRCGATLCRTGTAACRCRLRRAYSRRRHSNAAVRSAERPRGRRRAGNQRHPDRGEDGRVGGKTETTEWARRQPRVGFHQAAARDYRGIHGEPERFVTQRALTA